MPLVDSTKVLQIIQHTLNCVDPRLMEHGARVAWLALKLLDAAGERDPIRVRDLCMAALLHDVGAYKTEEIDQLLVFETSKFWQHAIYGYLFLERLSPLKELAPAVLFHHLEYRTLRGLDVPCKEAAQVIFLADRLDIYRTAHRAAPPRGYMERYRDTWFAGGLLDVLGAAEAAPGFYTPLSDGSYLDELTARMCAAPFTEDEINAYLRMVVYSIDFRSRHTVTHTITTERISVALAERLGLSGEARYKIRYGAILHDLGKIAIPVEILEFPGKLSPQAMRVMQTHVAITEQILGDSADPEMLRIAVRHHEKLDGSGYPRGLTGEVLTLPERILAVADIVSALSGTRSYKKAYGKERICAILAEQRERGLICPRVVDAVLGDYDGIMDEVRQACAPVLAAYSAMQNQFLELEVQCAELGAK